MRKRMSHWRRVISVVMLGLLAQPSSGSPVLYVSNHDGGNSISRFNLDGDFLGHLVAPGGELVSATGIQLAADGNILVSSEGTGRVLKYDRATGDYLGVFAQPPAGSGASFMTFGPGGDLYVSDTAQNQVLRYDGQTGGYINVAAAPGQLNGPDGIHFLEDGSMVVSSYFNNRIMRYDPGTGDELGVFTSNIARPLRIIDSHIEGELLAVAQGTAGVVRIDEQTGDVLGTFASDSRLVGPVGLIGLPNGHYLVSSYSNNRIVEFDEAGEYVRVFASGSGNGVHRPTNMLLVLPAPGVGGTFMLAGLGVIVRRRRR